MHAISHIKSNIQNELYHTCTSTEDHLYIIPSVYKFIQCVKFTILAKLQLFTMDMAEQNTGAKHGLQQKNYEIRDFLVS